MNYSDMELLIDQQCRRYPHLQAQDLVKAIYQAEFGCGHFVASYEKAVARILQEEKELFCAERPTNVSLVEPLGGDYCRIHLGALRKSGLSPQTLGMLFYLSARAPAADTTHFETCLDLLAQLIASGGLPIDVVSSLAWLEAYRRSGRPATHHSDGFRREYLPAYRVVHTKYARLIPLFAQIDRLCAERDRVVVAIEGGSASGKTSLASLLETVYDMNLFHMDDFFLRKSQRTPERFREVGGNIDRERFAEEVLSPLLRGEAFSYRPFDCSRMDFGEMVHVHPKQLNVVEGAYSMHPAFSSAYALSVFLKIDPELQSARLLARNGLVMRKRFLDEWIPMEEKYFAATDLPNRCDIVLSAEE